MSLHPESFLPLLLHLGDQHGLLHVWVLVVLGIAANAVYHASTGFGLVLRGPLARALVVAASGSKPRIGKVVLPLRKGMMTIDGIGLPGGLEVERVRADLKLLGIRGNEVRIPRLEIEGVRRVGAQERGGEGGGDGVPSTGDSSTGNATTGDATTGQGRRFLVEALVLRDPTSGEERSLHPPRGPVTLKELVKHVLAEVAPHAVGTPTPFP